MRSLLAHLFSSSSPLKLFPTGPGLHARTHVLRRHAQQQAGLQGECGGGSIEEKKKAKGEALSKNSTLRLNLSLKKKKKTTSSLQGRFFIDRDPKHFGVILNWLRDGTAVLPDGDAAVDELLQEAEFYQLRGLAAAAAAAAAGVSRPEPLTAQMLRESVAAQLQSQPRIAAALDVLLACAFGAGVRDGRRGAQAAAALQQQQQAASLCWNNSSSGSFPSPQYAWAANAAAAAAAASVASNRIPPRQAAVDVVLREAAFCPLSPQPKRAIARDEAL